MEPLFHLYNKMNKYLPSKKFIKFFGIAIVAGLVVFLLSKLLGDKTFYERKVDPEDLLIGEEVPDFYTKDADGDGIYDWEEILWGTNPNEQDSDGDGVSDKKEIEKKKEEVQKQNNISVTDLENEDLNQTEVFARQFFSTVVLTSQSGELTQDSIQSFSDSLSDVVSNNSIKDQFSLIDLKLSNVTKDAYKKSLEPIFAPLRNRKVSEVDILYSISKGSDIDPELLNQNIKIYSDLANSLVNVSAPHSAAGIHLALINSSAKVSIALISLKEIEDNPLSAMTGLSQYVRYSGELEKALEDLQRYFTVNAIIN